jgi:3'-5' exoribonuclease
MPPAAVPFHHAPAGKPSVFFAQLSDKKPGKTRDGKPFLILTFRDRRRTATAPVWADSPLAEAAEGWAVGGFFKVQAAYGDHERYGPQLDLMKVRPVTEADAADGFREADFRDRSRFDSPAMLAELRELAARELRDVPLKVLVLNLLDAHAERLQGLPAHPRNFFPFPGGWLEHTLGVAKNCLSLADRYVLHYPELTPPLNRDLILAGAILHDLGRVAELAPPSLTDVTVAGHLFGHQLLGRDLVRDAARDVPDLNPELLMLLEHVILSHLTRPEWGSVRQPAIPEVLILHHADDLDAKLESYIRCLTRDVGDGPLTERDAVVGKPLLKGRTV